MYLGLPQWLIGKESTCDAEDTGAMGSVPGLGRSPGGGHGNPLQYSGLENPMDGEAWQDATVHRVTKSRTWLKRQHARTHAHMCTWEIDSRHGIAESIDKCIYNFAGH